MIDLTRRVLSVNKAIPHMEELSQLILHIATDEDSQKRANGSSRINLMISTMHDNPDMGTTHMSSEVERITVRVVSEVRDPLRIRS